MPFPWMAAAVLGSSLLGAKGAKDAGKSQVKAAEIQNRGFEFSKPYLQRAYTGGEKALANALATGTYGGQTYAAPNPYQYLGNQYMGSQGLAGVGQASDLTNTGFGFGQNFADLYNRSNANTMGAAQDYALDNSQPLIDAAMRGTNRRIDEQVLPSINLGASASNNTNSSTVGVERALADRFRGDREAQVTTDINKSLMDDYLRQSNIQFGQGLSANRGLQDVYGAGQTAIDAAGNRMLGAGANFRGFDQGFLMDQYNRFNEARDFPLNQQIKFKQGILDNTAVSQSPQNPVVKTASTAAGALGGAMAGLGAYNQFNSAFGNAGNNVGTRTNTGFSTHPASTGYYDTSRFGVAGTPQYGMYGNRIY